MSVRSPTALMVGELAGEKGERYAMIVNLSLTRPAKVVVRARAKQIRRVSPADRSLAPLADARCGWRQGTARC